MYADETQRWQAEAKSEDPDDAQTAETSLTGATVVLKGPCLNAARSCCCSVCRTQRRGRVSVPTLGRSLPVSVVFSPKPAPASASAQTCSRQPP